MTYNRSVPHAPHEWRRPCSDERCTAGFPITLSCSAGTIAQATIGASACRRQSAQWHSAWCSTSAGIPHWTEPHWHRPLSSHSPPARRRGELRRLRQLEGEDTKLKELVADLSVDKAMLKAMPAKKP